MKYRGIYAGIFPGAVLILLAVHIATAVPIPQRLGPTEPIGEPNIVDPNLFPEQADNADLEFLEILESKDDLICNDKTSSRYEPLACWLWKLTVSLPNQSFKKLAFHVVSTIDSACLVCWILLIQPNFQELTHCFSPFHRKSKIYHARTLLYNQ